MNTAEQVTRDAIAVLSQNTSYLYIEGDRTFVSSLAKKDEWVKDEKIQALMLVHKYRRFLILKGVDYHSVFPKTKHNRTDVEKIKNISKILLILEKTYNIRPPRGYDLMPIDDLEMWVKEKAKEVIGAQRNG